MYLIVIHIISCLEGGPKPRPGFVPVLLWGLFFSISLLLLCCFGKKLSVCFALSWPAELENSFYHHQITGGGREIEFFCVCIISY